MNQVTFDRIRELLPQSYPMLMLDRVLDWSRDTRIRAVRSISGNDPLITGHFRSQAIVPGVLIIEGMAQSAQLLMLLSDCGRQGTFVIGGVKAKFLHPVTPGDQLVYDVTLDSAVRTGALFHGHAEVDGKKVASCELLVAIANYAVASPAEETVSV